MEFPWLLGWDFSVKLRKKIDQFSNEREIVAQKVFVGTSKMNMN